MHQESVLYSAVDDRITSYRVDALTAELTKLESIEVPAKVQYAWPHPSKNFLYVSTSSGGPRVASDCNHVSAYEVRPDGCLTLHGTPTALPKRAVHMCVDPTGRFIINAHNYQGGAITVHTIEPDGFVGSLIPQELGADFGIYPHQVMVFPSGKQLLIVDRGNKRQADKPEDPGALRLFRFDGGKAVGDDVIAPNGGHGFGPRHIDFHPTKPWLYASDERTNRLYMFRFAEGRIEAEPAYTLDTLAHPTTGNARQLAGPIHVHPSGKVVYVANRADATVHVDGQAVFTEGENNIAVYSLDSDTGEPTLQQHADTRSFHVRTFACDPTGRLLVTASIKPLASIENGSLKQTPATLTTFRIGDDGQLEFVSTYEAETTGTQLQYWMGIVGLK